MVLESVKVQSVAVRQVDWAAERRFYVGFSLLTMAAVLLGFARSFFLRPLFSEWAAVHSPQEPFFYFHGVLFLMWLLLLIAQTSLVAFRRIDVHRRLGVSGAVLAGVMVVFGIIAALIAARRPTGFVDVPVPPLQFLTVPLGDIAMFGIFVALGIAQRRKAQNHKRFILLGSILMMDAAVARWPFAIMLAPAPVPWIGMTDLFVDMFLLPLIVWDLISLRRIHPVTLWGGLALIASQVLRLMISGTSGWLAFATWAVSLLGS